MAYNVSQSHSAQILSRQGPGNVPTAEQVSDAPKHDYTGRTILACDDETQERQISRTLGNVEQVSDAPKHDYTGLTILACDDETQERQISRTLGNVEQPTCMHGAVIVTRLRYNRFVERGRIAFAVVRDGKVHVTREYKVRDYFNGADSVSAAADGGGADSAVDVGRMLNEVGSNKEPGQHLYGVLPCRFHRDSEFLTIKSC